MAESNWATPNTTAVSGGSASINNPGKWCPHAVYRTYLNEDQPKTTKVIATIFEDEWCNSLYEPIIVSSTYRTKKDGFVAFLWWNHTWWWFKWTDAKVDGAKKRITAETGDTAEFSKSFANYTEIELFGCPLISVTDSDTIKSRIVDPLVRI